MAHVISVTPENEAWKVQTSAFDNPQIFRSGARAEAAAIALGRRYASAGHACEIVVYLRDGRLAGRFVCPAQDH